MEEIDWEKHWHNFTTWGIEVRVCKKRWIFSRKPEFNISLGPCRLQSSGDGRKK
jgi:hypothetical protein